MTWVVLLFSDGTIRAFPETRVECIGRDGETGLLFARIADALYEPRAWTLTERPDLASESSILKLPRE